MQGRVFYFSILFLLFFMVEVTFAAEMYPFFRGVRAEGMGGASVAVVNDETALLINPAGLGKIRNKYVAMANPEIETTMDSINAFGWNLNNYLGIQNPQSLLGLAQANPDKNLHAKLQVLPAFLATNFGFGVYAKYSVDALFSSTTNQMSFKYQNDYAAVIGYCFRIWEGRIKLGLSGKIVNRVDATQTIPANTVNLNLGNLVTEGTGVGWDASLMLTAPWAWLPTLAIVGHDIGNTYFNMGNGLFFKPGTQPSAQYQSVDVGLAVFPYDGKTTRYSITAEWRDAQNPETQDIFRRIHAGAEVNFGDVFYLRAGMNQRYWTAGLEFDIDRTQLQLATYGEEIGTATANKEDRRYTFQYVIRF